MSADNQLSSIRKSISRTFILDVLRGLAALYVLVGHAKWLLWEGYTEGYKTHPELYSVIDKVQVFGFTAFSFGHQAVMLFFVLSGFVIHYSSYNQTIRFGSFSIRTYVWKRIKRIYPPFLLAILLTFLLDNIGKNQGYSIYTSTTNFPIINESIFSDLSWQTLLGNICMLQKLVTRVWGSNGPLWSLMYEWWFYILYILVFFINKRKPVLTACLIGLVFILSLFIPYMEYKWITVINYFFAWYLGVIAADWYLGRLGNVREKFMLISYLVAVLAIATHLKGNKYMSDYYMAVAFVGVVYLSLLFYKQLRYFQVLQPLGDFSYSLYVIHMPVIVLMSGWLQKHSAGALPMHFGYVYLGIGICLLIGWGAHFIAEKPFVRKRN